MGFKMHREGESMVVLCICDGDSDLYSMFYGADDGKLSEYDSRS